MNKLYLLTAEIAIGSTRSYLYDRVGAHQILAIPRLRLEHEPALRLAEGASILSLFSGSMCAVAGRTRRASVLSGTYLLHTTSDPVLKDVIVFVPKEGEPHPQLGQLISKGVALINAVW